METTGSSSRFNSPHQAALRKGRVSLPNQAYTLTCCVNKRENRLVPDPHAPESGHAQATVIGECLRWLHQQGRVICHGYVMPDHVHIVMSLCPGHALSEVVGSFRRFTARQLNVMAGRSGAFWQPGYFDTGLRSEAAMRSALVYIANNPVRKGYVVQPEEWPYTEVCPSW